MGPLRPTIKAGPEARCGISEAVYGLTQPLTSSPARLAGLSDATLRRWPSNPSQDCSPMFARTHIALAAVASLGALALSAPAPWPPPAISATSRPCPLRPAPSPWAARARPRRCCSPAPTSARRPSPTARPKTPWCRAQLGQLGHDRHQPHRPQRRPLPVHAFRGGLGRRAARTSGTATTAPAPSPSWHRAPMASPGDASRWTPWGGYLTAEESWGTGPARAACLK